MISRSSLINESAIVDLKTIINLFVSPLFKSFGKLSGKLIPLILDLFNLKGRNIINKPLFFFPE
jgi:hypothetical protein